MQLSEQQEEAVQQHLQAAGARGQLLQELADHWCVLVEIEMKAGACFLDALQNVSKAQTGKVKLLVAEINELRFPYVIAPGMVRFVGFFSISIFAVGVAMRFSYHFYPVGLLLPGYILTAYFFLPLWFLQRLYKYEDKVASTLLFLNLHSLTHLLVLWLNHARPRWIALGCWLLLLVFWALYYFFRIRKSR
jgi:hypothetical protein